MSTGGNVPKLLIVDGDVVWTTVVAAYLGPRGFRVSVAADVLLALAIAHAQSPDLLLLDLLLPGTDGLAFLRATRSAGVLAGVPVVVSSALTGAGVVSQAAALGVRHYLVKSRHSLVELLDALRQALNG